MKHSDIAKVAAALFVVAATVPAASYMTDDAGAAPFSSTVGSAAQSLPASMPFADSAFESVWRRNDQPVITNVATRSWAWGPAPLASGLEQYTDAPDGSGKRLVQYFDKARMEINNPNADPTGKSYVTNGLLTVELISGQMQIGNSKFVTMKPAGINLASDIDDGNAPTYASFGTVSNTSGGAKRMPDESKGGAATGRIDRSGGVKDDSSKASLGEAKIAYYDQTTGHNVPRVFMDFLNSIGTVRVGVGNSNKPLLDPWVFAMGLPISDAYWANVKIGGKQQDVLIQAFERRVLTYAPSQPAQWRVAMGNIGQHYYEWRYGSNSVGLQKRTVAAPAQPAYLAIPAMGVDTKVEYVGVDKNNNMDIPKDPFEVAWFKPGTVPGNPGNSVMDGHLNWYGIPQAVFYNLGVLKPGDRLYVRDTAGRERAFVVTKQQVCPYNNCPLTDIFGPTSAVRLNLITCSGTFDRTQQNYDKRMVIYSEMVQ